jgi:hypothetical protein
MGGLDDRHSILALRCAYLPLPTLGEAKSYKAPGLYAAYVRIAFTLVDPGNAIFRIVGSLDCVSPASSINNRLVR